MKMKIDLYLFILQTQRLKLSMNYHTSNLSSVLFSLFIVVIVSEIRKIRIINLIFVQ